MDFRSVAGDIIIIFNLIVLFYFAAINTIYIVLFAAAFAGSIKYNRHRRFVDFYEVFRSPLTPSISVLVPAYNEEATIVEAVRSMLLLRYPHFEVVVINDGSSDRTLELLGEKYNLRRVGKVVPMRVPCSRIRGVYISPDYDNLVVVDKENGGKADALNAGINVSRHDLVCVIDADSLIEPEGLLKVARPFIENPSTTVAVGGLIRIVNGCTVEGGSVTRVRLPGNYLANLQTIEYLRAFLGGRIGWSALRSLLIISGAFGLFDRRLAIEVEGYRTDTVGEDMDLVVRMHRHLRVKRKEYTISFVPDPVCWTEAPEKLRQLSRQRDRWQRGLIESLTSNIGMLMNPRYGPIGLFAMPYFFFFEMLGPVVELSGYILIVLALVLGLLNVQFFYLFFTVAFLYAIAVSLFAVLLEGIALRHFPRVPALLKLAFYSIIENFGYRQVNAWWRTKAFFTLFTRRQTWGALERKGYEGAAEEVPPGAAAAAAAAGVGALTGEAGLPGAEDVAGATRTWTPTAPGATPAQTWTPPAPGAAPAQAGKPTAPGAEAAQAATGQPASWAEAQASMAGASPFMVQTAARPAAAEEEPPGLARNRRVTVIAAIALVVLTAVIVIATVSLTHQDRRVKHSPTARAGGVEMAARAHGRYFQVYDGARWNDFLVRGVNVGIAMPGKWFSEFPADAGLYRSWFEDIAALNANTIRVYTLLDPVFYRTLYDFNKSRSEPLMLLQEVWPDDEVPGDNLYDEGFTGSYHDEIAMDLEALAGKKKIPERKGRAWGDYNADVTPYVLGVIVGREIIYEEASTTNALNPGKTSFEGEYARAPNGSRPVETWMAETCDYTIGRMRALGWEAPVAFVSWPTLDPMTHPTEATPGVPKQQEQEDSEVLDPGHILPKEAATAGLFGCYHIYPYYPDFMNREPGYADYRDPEGVLRYGGYIRQFISVHPEYPALMGEFGMSTSMGRAHIHPEGFDHGAVDEKRQGRMVARMYRAIAREGYAGGAIFEWADEWSKRTWVDMDYMIPFDRHIYWHNMMDPEQCFGLMAYEAAAARDRAVKTYWTSEDDPADSKAAPAAAQTSPAAPADSKAAPAAAQDAPASPRAGIRRIGVNHDEAFVYLELDLEGKLAGELEPGSGKDLQLEVGIDTIGKDNGTVKLPVEGLPDLPGGVEFLLRINSKDGALLLARPDYNRGTTKFMAARAADPEFVHIELLVNRLQVNSIDGTIFPGEYTDDSLLRHGVYLPESKDYYSLANWYVSDDGGKVFVRLPWLLLNVSDPSSLTVIHDDRTDLPEGPAAVRTRMGIDALRTEKTAGFSFYAVTTRSGKVEDFQPRKGSAWADTGRFTWKGWDVPTYTSRLKQSYPEVKALFGDFAKSR